MVIELPDAGQAFSAPSLEAAALRRYPHTRDLSRPRHSSTVQLGKSSKPPGFTLLITPAFYIKWRKHNGVRS
jgi:hypothetical protein